MYKLIVIVLLLVDLQNKVIKCCLSATQLSHSYEPTCITHCTLYLLQRQGLLIYICASTDETLSFVNQCTKLSLICIQPGASPNAQDRQFLSPSFVLLWHVRTTNSNITYINQEDAQNSCDQTLFSISCSTCFGLIQSETCTASHRK